MYQTEQFVDRAKAIGVELSDTQVQQFVTYYEMLVEQNKYMNLTAITAYDEVIDKHFIDSISLNKAVNVAEKGHIKVIDVGTGAGFPGIPLKIAFPELEITLLDSLNKRVNFLNEVIAALKLENIHAMHGRAEDFGRNPEYREAYDLCVSRAVAQLATLGEYCMPFVKIGGQFIPYKSGDIKDELKNAQKAIKILGGHLNHVESFKLPETDIERTLVIIDKTGKTGKTYPRKAGKPSKEPLGMTVSEK